MTKPLLPVCHPIDADPPHRSTSGDRSRSSMPAGEAIPGDGAQSTLSGSTIMARTVSGYHVLKIDGFSRTMTVGNGGHLKSSSFHVGGYTWHMRYYPNGDRSETADFISLHLSLENPPPSAAAVKAEHQYSLLDCDGKTVPYSRNCRNEFSSENPSWGYKSFIKREAFKVSGYFKDDSFSVRCDVTVIVGFLNAPDIPSVVVPPSDWPRHLGDLLLSGQGTDVMFRVGGETFPAHRCVLAARSPVFRAELFGAMKEGAAEHCVQIDGMRAEVFRNLLHYTYTDSLRESTAEGKHEEVAMAQHLLVAADRYGMERLRLICEERLCRHIDVSTVATTLALAGQHRCDGLKAACFEFLRSKKNIDAVMDTDGSEHLARSCPSVLFELISKLCGP